MTGNQRFALWLIAIAYLPLALAYLNPAAALTDAESRLISELAGIRRALEKGVCK